MKCKIKVLFLPIKYFLKNQTPLNACVRKNWYNLVEGMWQYMLSVKNVHTL